VRYSDADWNRRAGVDLKVGDERSPSEIDRSRILHSAAFRRLGGKTQIFGVGQDPFFRSRLTHSLEVAQIAKGIALKTEADIETCEAASLAHDIGHPPFGHRGEEVLAGLMREHGGFEANAQNFRVLGLLEVKFPDHGGLDLTRAVLDAVVKYRDGHVPSSGVNR
jgi:dGTPase